MQGAAEGALLLEGCAESVALKKRCFHRNMEAFQGLGLQLASLASMSVGLSQAVSCLGAKLRVRGLLPWHGYRRTCSPP